MIKFFRNIRKNLLNEDLPTALSPEASKRNAGQAGKTTKYLKYAIGEIILVVIGILIALSINNWNEERKEQNRLVNIYSLIYSDIEDDINELQRNVDFYNEKKFVFEAVVHDSIAPDLLDHGLSSLLFNSPKTLLNKKGVSQLAELQENNRLTFYLYDIYEFMETNMLPLENRISNEMIDHKKYVRDNYDWFPEWINNPITQNLGDQEMHNYFLTNSNYRNRVVFIYDQVYNNYVLTVKALIKSLTKFKQQISEIIKEAND